MTLARGTLLLLLSILYIVPVVGWAGARPPVRTAQITQSPEEPPLADPTMPGADSPILPPASEGLSGESVLPGTEGTVCPIDPPTPRVSLRVRVAATAATGQDLEYRICVHNPSRAAAHHVIVRNPVPTNARFVRARPRAAATEPEVVWRLGTLQPGACRELVLVLQPTGGDVNCCARVSFEHGQCVTTRVGQGARPALTLRKTGPAQAILNEAVTFRLEVVNTGTAPLTDVGITDILPKELRYVEATPEPSERRALLRWTIGTLNAGETRVIEYRALALQEGSYANRAVATASGGLRQEAVSRLTVGKPRLSLVVTGPERRYANLPAVFELTVSNDGTTPATNVTLTNPLPASTRFVSASEGGALGGNEVRWLLGTLAAGARRTLKLQLSASGEGEVVNRATVRADGDMGAQAEAKTRFEGVAGLSAALSDRDPLEVGQEGSYLLVIRNTGTGVAGEVKVTALVPPQLQATDAQGPGTSKPVLQADRVTFEAVAIEAGKDVRYTIYVKALRAGDVRFRVQITANVLPAGPLLEEESTTIFEDR